MGVGRGRGKNREWDPRELELLRERWPTSTAAEIGRALRRTKASVSCRARLLNLLVKKRGPWSAPGTVLVGEWPTRPGYAPRLYPRIRVSEWGRDEQGCLTRTVEGK